MESREATILYNKEVLAGHYRIGLGFKAFSVKPGQFVMVRVTGGLDPLLRRPLGIYDVIDGAGRAKKGKTGEDGGIELFYRVVGRGTALLSEKRPGETVNVLGPLGNTFPSPKKGERPVLVAGGMGIASLLLLAKRLGKAGKAGGVLLFGVRHGAEASFSSGFAKTGVKVKVASEDGKSGLKGLVTALMDEELGAASVVYACGPAGMLKAVAAKAERAGARCFVSLERSMACGIGVCLGCAVRSGHESGPAFGNYKMVCSDGPVFDARDIDWERFDERRP